MLRPDNSVQAAGYFPLMAQLGHNVECRTAWIVYEKANYIKYMDKPQGELGGFPALLRRMGK